MYYPKVKLQTVEAAPPEGMTAVDWTLISTIPAPDFAGAWRLVACYTLCWLIERLHFVLKSGLDAEKLRLDDAHSLQNALALYYLEGMSSTSQIATHYWWGYLVVAFYRSDQAGDGVLRGFYGDGEAEVAEGLRGDGADGGDGGLADQGC